MKRYVSGILSLVLAFLCASSALGDAAPYLTVTGALRLTVSQSKATNFLTNAIRFEAGSEDPEIAAVSADGKTITGVGVGQTVVVFSGYFPGRDQPIIKEVVVTVTDGTEADDTFGKFMLPSELRQKLLQSGEDAQMAFALNNLVVRDSSGNKVGALAVGEAVALTGAASDDRLLVLTGNGLEGSVAVGGLARFSGTEAVARVADAVNMRLGPSILYERMDTLPGGETVSVLTTDGKWSLVNAGGTVGYVSSNYLLADTVKDTGADIRLSSDTLRIVQGKTAKITYTGNDPAAQANWQSANKHIATVENDVVTGVSVGDTYMISTGNIPQVVKIEVVSQSASEEYAAASTLEDDEAYSVTAADLPVRQEPRVGATIIGYCQKGDMVYGKKCKDLNWLYSAEKGGYLSMTYLKKK